MPLSRIVVQRVKEVSDCLTMKPDSRRFTVPLCAAWRPVGVLVPGLVKAAALGCGAFWGNLVRWLLLTQYLKWKPDMAGSWA